MRKPTNKELHIYSLLGEGHDSRISLRDLERLSGIDYRIVSSIVACLVNDFEVPVVSDRKDYGIFIAMNDEEKGYVSSIESQGNKLIKRSKIVRLSDYKAYKKHFQDTDENKKDSSK